MNSETLWCVHVEGPDTLIAQPSMEAAERRANEWNRMIAASLARDPSPNDPFASCEAKIWPYSPERHALDLAKHGGNPDDIC